MNINISNHNMESSESLTIYVNEKLEEAVFKFFEGDIRADVIFNKDAHHKNLFDASIVLNEGNAHNSVLKSDAEAADIYVAFDSSLQKLVTQLRKLKDKSRDHHKKEKMEVEKGFLNEVA
jgi:ribosomal subunit interface protein